MSNLNPEPKFTKFFKKPKAQRKWLKECKCVLNRQHFIKVNKIRSLRFKSPNLNCK